MKIGFGRKWLVVSLVDATPGRRDKSIQIPYAVGADDLELARLNSTMYIAMDRPQWEPNALLYGSVRAKNA